MIEIENVSKKYGDVNALSNVSLNIAQGEVVGLLGPNGAGKTTLIRTLTGYFEPSNGTILVGGVDNQKQPQLAQAKIGYMPEQSPLYPEMLLQEYLAMVADIRGVPEADRLRCIAEAVWATDLQSHLTKPISQLSKGFRQRVCLAQAIIHRPEVLILDEPTSGLDPTQVIQVRRLISRLAQKTTVLFSTHILSEVEAVCERAIILLNGEVKADAKLEELRTTREVIISIHKESLKSSDSPQKIFKAVDGIHQVDPVAEKPNYLTLSLAGQEEIDMGRAAFEVAKNRGWVLGEIRPVVRNLETVFRELVEQSKEEPQSSKNTEITSNSSKSNQQFMEAQQ